MESMKISLRLADWYLFVFRLGVGQILEAYTTKYSAGK